MPEWAGVYPGKRLDVLDYDRLAADRDFEMRKIAVFSGISFSETKTRPTKNLIPWFGNFSLDMVSEAVFADPSIAGDIASNEDQGFIRG